MDEMQLVVKLKKKYIYIYSFLGLQSVAFNFMVPMSGPITGLYYFIRMLSN